MDPKLTHNMEDEEKNIKNMGCFFENEDDKVRRPGGYAIFIWYNFL